MKCTEDTKLNQFFVITGSVGPFQSIQQYFDLLFFRRILKAFNKSFDDLEEELSRHGLQVDTLSRQVIQVMTHSVLIHSQCWGEPTYQIL